MRVHGARAGVESAAAGEPTLLDRSLKALVRRVPAAAFRLCGAEVDPARTRTEDVTVNLPEFRADQVLVVTHERGRTRSALHLEYQLQPDARRIPGWMLKNAAFQVQLGVPVVLVVVYLTRGRYRRFPRSHTVIAEGLRNTHRFHAVRLWEHADRIRSGDLGPLAPLLVLCEDEPTERTLLEERERILRLDAPRPLKSDLLGLALTVGSHYFPRDLLFSVFREKLQMLKEASFVEEWIAEAAATAEARGRIEGEARGEARGARDLLLRQLQSRFGPLPLSAVARVESADLDRCLELAERLLRARSLSELELS
jgi:predicted transposase YdaD